MKIRKATKKDIKEIAELLHKYNKYEHSLDKTYKVDTIKQSQDFVKKLMQKSYVIFFVLEHNGKLYGTTSGEYRNTAMGKSAIFHNMFISQDCRKKGYGKKLLKKLENHFKKLGCRQIKSFVFKNNKSINFYKKLGYDYEAGFNITKKLK